jgi:hypothetical protein
MTSSKSSKGKKPSKNVPVAEEGVIIRDGEIDDLDRENITALFAIYEELYPYPHPESIGRSVELGILETTRDDSEKRKNKKMQKALSLPRRLMEALKVGYPDIIKNDKQFRWFLDNFPMLDLTNPDQDTNADYKKIREEK